MIKLLSPAGCPLLGKEGVTIFSEKASYREEKPVGKLKSPDE